MLQAILQRAAVLKQTIDINHRDKLGNTPLLKASKSLISQEAAQSNRVKILLAIISYSKSAMIDLQDTEGMSALMLAIQNGRAEIAKILLAAGASLWLFNNWGRCSLMMLKTASKTVKKVIEDFQNEQIRTQKSEFKETGKEQVVISALEQIDKQIMELILEYLAGDVDFVPVSYEKKLWQKLEAFWKKQVPAVVTRVLEHIDQETLKLILEYLGSDVDSSLQSHDEKLQQKPEIFWKRPVSDVGLESLPFFFSSTSTSSSTPLSSTASSTNSCSHHVI